MILYNIIYRLLYGILKLCYPILGDKTKSWIQLRNNKDIYKSTFKKTSPRLWIHASSGEIEYAKGFIREFKNVNSDAQIFVSYSSLSAPNLFANIAENVTAFFPLNWDLSKDNSRLIDHIKPDILIFSRTDFWPNLISQAKIKNITLAAISVNQKISMTNALFLRTFCKSFNYFSCVNENQISFLKKNLPQTHIQHIPDTRYDQVLFRLRQHPKILLNPEQKYFTFGSTWPEDEEILVQSCAELFNKSYSIIWAPHDVNRSKQLLDKLLKMFPQRKIFAYSNFNANQNFDVLVIDRIGILADCYRSSKLSFVGGSFVGRVHSVMEPLCAENLVLVGPYYKNNPEAVTFKSFDFVTPINSSAEFLNAVTKYENNLARRETLKSHISSMVGGSKKTVSAIADLLKL